MNATSHNDWIEINRQALGGEFNRLRRLLEGVAHLGEDGVSEAPGTSAPLAAFLCDQLQLSGFECALLLLCAGIEVEADFPRLCALARGEAGCDYPTFGLALAVLPGAHWSALSPQAPLRYWQLVQVSEPSHLTTTRLSIDERILHFLLGVPVLDSRLAGLVRVLTPVDPLPPSHSRQAERLQWLWREAQDRMPIVCLQGPDPGGARAVAAQACVANGLRPLALRTDDIPPHADPRMHLARLLTRECLLTRSALILEMADLLSPSFPVFLEQLACPVILLGEPPAALQHRCFMLEIEKPLAEEQRELWRAALDDQDDIGASVLGPLTAQFDFSAADIAAAAEETRLEIQNGVLPPLAVRQVCRRRARGGLDQLAQRITPRVTWGDLVLPAGPLAILHDIARQVRRRATVYECWGFAAKSGRGLGISALFTGESGTGKTLAAEIIATDLGIDLYRIDLSAVVSKYIGETEKNMERLFVAAETSGAVLLFDEADALFGKRSEVRDSHDRYANIELAYLLQRMETYRGLSILTTNLKSLLDTAFMRRIRFIVQFPFPDLAQRAEIWRRVFPVPLPCDELKIDQLARLQMAGGSIRNIALNAAFLAADDGGRVSMVHLARAARREYAKLEKPLSGAEIDAWQ